MAYSKAWTIVKSSERILGVQLLHTSVGGRSGGGAQLTEEAVLLLEAYTAFCADLHAAGDALFAQHFGYLEAGRKQLLYLTVSRKAGAAPAPAFLFAPEC